ncbi:DUF7133 domain-containing protein [Alienimonas californiensis]|uniref:Cytochrome c n=1 Tax=Alienimonas californiensis TaxID=2527989 RepID=A0A517P776_9PLAN|nr:HEAT repeat domain-containing protein [Alienimonas californiensis]QDT15231.1 Cytochrome c [Alienimonas californiensis]
MTASPIAFSTVVPALCVAWLAAPPADSTLVAPTEALSPAEQQTQFRLPPGFEIQLVAAEPEIGQPMNLAFDGAGRLWVTHSTTYPFPVEGPGTEPRAGGLDGTTPGPPRDRLSVLSDFAADGRARSVEHVADDLNIPIGLLPLDGAGADDAGGTLVYSIPNLWRTPPGGGEKTPLVTGYGNVDAHGMTNSFTRGLDGWIYACHGFRNDSRLVGSDGSTLPLNSGNTYRFQPDGSRLQQFTHGQVNPFGMTFDPLGNIYNADCHSRPLTLLLRGAYYPSFGKPDDGLGYGPEMIDHSHGSTGICGAAWYDADHFPQEYRDALYLCNPVTGRVHRDRVRWAGSTARADTQPDFVRCDDPWFRPVYVTLGPDGALYLADFYNAVIGHYEAPLDHPARDRRRGRIWRIVWRGEGTEEQADPPPAPVDLAVLPADALADHFADPNIAVRTAATHEWVDRVGAAGAATLDGRMNDSEPTFRVHAAWALHRAGGLTDDRLAALLADPDRTVRTHGAKLLAERDAADDLPRLKTLLADADPFVRRAAAEALGRRPDAGHVRPLLTALAAAESGTADDAMLIHQLRIGLRDCLRASVDGAPTLAADEFTSEERRRLAGVLVAVPTAGGAEALAALLAPEGPPFPPADVERFVAHVTRYGSDERLDELLAKRWETTADPLRRVGLLRAAAEALRQRGADPTAVLGERGRATAAALLNASGAGAFESTAAAAGLIAELNLTDAAAGLRERLADPSVGRAAAGALAGALATLRRSAAADAASLLISDGGLAGPQWDGLRAALAGGNEPAVAEAVGAALSVAPAPLRRAAAERLAADAAGATLLTTLAERGAIPPRLLIDPTVGQRLGGVADAALAARVAALTADLPAEDAGLEALLAARAAAFDPAVASAERGAALYKTQCAACHAVGGVGGAVAPQLDGVGVRGVARLCEDVLAPHRNVDAAFRTVLLVLEDGRVVTGLPRRTEGETLILADAEGKEFAVPTTAVLDRADSPLSLMPGNFGETLTETQFADLLAYLLAQREPAQQEPAEGASAAK